MDLIQLIDFQQPILIEQNEIDNNNGTLRCETFKTIKNIKPKMYKGVGDMQCYGWVDSCQSIRDDITRRKPAVYCFSDHYKRLTWVRDTNYHQYGYENRRCRRIKLESDEAIKSKKDYISNACLCKCTRKSDNPKLNTTNWAFSLQPQISDIENNKVVTGVRIANHSKIIHLEIKESRIGSYKDDSWKSPGSLEGLIRDVDYSFLQPDSRSINLDKIVVPADYVVTGVKFIKIRSTYAAGQEWTLRLEVQGTKFDVAARKLLKNTSTWFNSDTSAAPLKYYGQNRSRIFMERWDPLSPVHNDDKKCIPNTYIKFTTTKLNEDLGRFTIPYMSTRPVELKTNRFLSGISLLYKGKSGYVGYIAPGIHLNLNITFENNTTDIIMAKENKTEFFMNKDVEDVTIPNENQIESGFPNDKKIAGSRMENITINTTTEESIGKGYTIDESRIQLTTEKTNGANENSIDAKNEQGNTMKAKETLEPNTTEVVVGERNMRDGQNTASILTRESMKNKFPTIGSTESSIKDEYSEINGTKEIMSIVNAIEENIKERNTLEITTGKENLLQKSVFETNTTGATIGKGNTTHAEFIKVNPLGTTNKNESITKANSPAKVITAGISISEGQTTESVALKRSMRHKLHENESPENIILDAYSDKKTTVKTLSAGNAIEAITENESTTIVAQLESTTAGKILSEMSVKERNKMEVISEEQNMILARAIVIPSTSEATTERSSMTEEQTKTPTTTDRSVQEEIYESESSDINMTDEYLENDTTEEIMKAGNTIEPTTENDSVTITGQSESTTAEISADISLKGKNEMETTSKERNMLLAGATVEPSMTETSTEESRITEGKTTTITTTDRSMQEEIYKSESSDINMIDAHSEKSTTEEIMKVGNTIEPTTENESVTITGQFESTTAEKILLEMSVKERNKMEVTTEIQNMILVGPTVKPSMTETTPERNSMIEGQTIGSTTTDRSMQEEIYKSESSDINMTDEYLENDTTEEIMKAENTIEPTTENESVTITGQSESTTAEISADISLKEKNEMETTSKEQNMWLAGATVEASMTETSTEESRITEGQTMTITTTDRSMQKEIYKSESSDINMTNGYLENDTSEEIMEVAYSTEPTTEYQSATVGTQSEPTITEMSADISLEEKNIMETTSEEQNIILTGAFEIMEAENAIKPTTENLSVTIATQLKSTTPKISVDISLEEKNIMEATSEEQNIMLTGTFVKPSTTETSTEESRITEGQTITITTTDRSMQEEIYKSESSDINMTNGYLENDTSEEIMEAENAIKPTTENLSVTIATQSESTTTEISVDISLEEKNQTEATTEKQNKILAGATVKPSVTEATTERSSMIEGQTITSTTTVRSMQEEIYKSESSDINMIDGYLEKNTTEEITEAGNAIEPTTEYQRVTITEKSTNNIITETTGVRKALIEEYEIDSNTSESTLGEETSTNEIMSKENTVKDPDEEETSTKVVIEETTVMVPKIMTPNTLETITDEKNVTEGQSMASTITNQSMGNELYTSESSDIRMLDAYSEKNKTAEFTLLGDTIETMTKNHNITIASQTKSITVTEIPSEESVKERNKTETITEIAKTSTLDTNAEVEHMKEAQNLEANVVGKVRIDKFPKYVLKERPSVPTIENESMTDTIEKEGMIVTEKKLTEKIINETITAKENTAVPQSTNFNMTKEADTMNEFLISLSESSATEAISQNELMIEKSTNDIIAEDESILVASPTTNNTMADKIIQKESIINLRTAGMNTIKAISDEKTITEKQTIDAITTERSLKNELQTSGSSEINENTIKPTTKIENIAIKTQSSNNSITDKTTEKTIMQNDEPAMDNSILESIATTGSITEKTTISQRPRQEMSYNDGGRSLRKSGSKSPKKLRVTKTENSDKATTTISYGNNHHHHHRHHHYHRHNFIEAPQPSIHKRNLYIVSFPLILVFNLLRTLLYQLFVVFKYIYASTGHLIRRRQANKGQCQLEIIVRPEPSTNELLAISSVGRQDNNTVDMSQITKRTTGPGPGDPLLAKQKHHHRRAFEFISKALKIDEENEGHKEMAIELYKKGIGELEKGVAVECYGGKGEVYERAQRLHEKMRANLAMAKDRLDFLANVCSLKKLEITNDCRGGLKTTTSENCTEVYPRLRRNTAGVIHANETLMDTNNITNRHSNNTNTANVNNGIQTQISKSTQRPRSPKSNCNIRVPEASGRKLAVPGKRIAGGVMNKSQTLPRSMGRSAPILPCHRTTPIKPSGTPPSIKRQLSVPGNGSPIRRPVTPSGSSSNRGTPTRKIPILKGVDSKLAQVILDEILEGSPAVLWDDVAGQDVAKQALQEMVILPSIRPELFTGLRTPARGLLLFGPPGNGKTLLARAVATQCNATFFSISAASLTSKYVGEGEKLVRALFAIARELQPSVIFIDEVDSLLSERRDNEHEASRRLKTEFLVEFDGLPSNPDERVLVMAATNRPQELDEAALRRFTKRVYVTLPDLQTRIMLLKRLLAKHNDPLSAEELFEMAVLTEGYSGSDLTGLAKDAALGPIRELNPEQVKALDLNLVRNITLKDFLDSLKRIRRSVSPSSLAAYEKWSLEYGDVSL
ncbi:hypothetical protein PV328_003361 [Microctonus aethiopoides]|uniref:Spastin n=1 Tax=Microctonus aethiopoides TaxID=144406 RepID=A0AA39KKH2_9HYME|nr:hypothetical protein PV328_003361 [Microctonus aethiopoides]